MKSDQKPMQGARYASVIGAALGASPLLGKQQTTNAELSKAMAWLYKDTKGLLESIEKPAKPQQ